MVSRDVEVVVTGMGVVSPAGIGVGAYRQAILDGRSGIRPIDAFRSDDLPVRIAGLVQGLDPLSFLAPHEVPHVNRAAQLVLAATAEAIGPNADAVLQDRSRVAVTLGVCSGGMEVMTRELEELWKGNVAGMAANSVPQLMDNSAASWISLKYGLQGPSYCFATACATSMDCLGIASDSSGVDARTRWWPAAGTRR